MRTWIAALTAAALLTVAGAATAQDYAVPTKPEAVKLKAKKIGKRKYKATATVVLYEGQVGNCEAGEARFTAVGKGSLTTTFDAACKSRITVKAKPGTKLRVRFGGTDTLLPKTSKTIRLRK